MAMRWQREALALEKVSAQFVRGPLRLFRCSACEGFFTLLVGDLSR